MPKDSLQYSNDDQYQLALLSDDDDFPGRNGTNRSRAMTRYNRSASNSMIQTINGTNVEMRREIAHLEGVLANRIASQGILDKSSLPIERSSKIDKYVEVMELTKCLRRQKEFLLSENRKRQRFAEKIQQAMPPSTDSIAFMKNVKYPSDGELDKLSSEAYREMVEYDVNGKPTTYCGWKTKRESKSMFLHAYSEKTFEGHDMMRVFNETWAFHHDEEKSGLYRRRSKFCVLKKLNDNMYLTRNIHQYIGESFPRHAMTLVSRMSIDNDNYAIISKSVVPQVNDAQHLVWTEECFMWKFTKRNDLPTGGFDVSYRGKYGSTSAVAGNRLPMLESYFFLVDWEAKLIGPLFNFQQEG